MWQGIVTYTHLYSLVLCSANETSPNEDRSEFMYMLNHQTLLGTCSAVGKPKGSSFVKEGWTSHPHEAKKISPFAARQDRVGYNWPKVESGEGRSWERYPSRQIIEIGNHIPNPLCESRLRDPCKPVETGFL